MIGIDPFANKPRVFVAGEKGMVGRALVRRLAREDCTLLTADRRTLNLTDQRATFNWLEENRPDIVIVAAAKVGGILANATRPADFIYDNLVIETNLIEAARRAGVRKLLFLGSSCIYPKFAPQPMPEDCLLTGQLEPTNEWYAIAKIAGVKLCQAYRAQHGCDFISAMPTNLYGPFDNFDPLSSHVLPAMVRRMDEAKRNRSPQFEIWGTGTPKREFLHVDDLADACIFLLKNYSGDVPINVGSGQEVSIRELAERVASTVGWTGEFVYRSDRPDGTPRKLLDVSRLTALGWTAGISLEEGLRSVHAWYQQNAA